MMNWFLLIIILLSCFLVFLLAFFALSSCLGDEFRAVWSGRQSATPTTYGMQYARLMADANGSGPEGIEMADLSRGRFRRSEDDY